MTSRPNKKKVVKIHKNNSQTGNWNIFNNLDQRMSEQLFNLYAGIVVQCIALKWALAEAVRMPHRQLLHRRLSSGTKHSKRWGPEMTIMLTRMIMLTPEHKRPTQHTTTILRPFVRDYPGEPVPEETLTHPPSWSTSSLYQLLPSTMIHSILLVQTACLAIFLHNLFSCPLWSTSWSGALHLIFHTFLHPISVFFSQHVRIPSQPVLL